MKKLLDILIPRFLTEDVALSWEGTHYVPICAVKDLEPHEKPDAVVSMSCFNFFGIALFPKQVGEVMVYKWEVTK